MFDRAWRVIATAFCFSVFGLGGVLIGLVAFPVLIAMSPNRALRMRRAQALIHHIMRLFLGLMRRVGVISLEVHGAQRLARGAQLVLANHPSLIDVVILMSLLKQTNCIVKGALWRNPFTRGPIIAAGYISNHGGSALIADCVAALQQGDNLIVFPEGTRTPVNGPMQMQRGAANIAVRAACIVTPVVIQVSTPMLPKGRPWYRVPPTRPHFIVTVEDDLDMQTFLAQDRPATLAARDLTQWLHDFFTRETKQIAAA
jgi:1-acyl-sn-glycerol-3-phosphate acyltransferase